MGSRLERTKEQKTLKMQNPHLFVLSHSFLNKFLYTEIGIEKNGSPLTILSVLARLGKDPWAEAEHCLKMPQSKAVDCLARDLLNMEVYANRLDDARHAASQAIARLHSSRKTKTGNSSAATAKIGMALIFCVFALGLGFNILLVTKLPAKLLSSNPNYIGSW